MTVSVAPRFQNFNGLGVVGAYTFNFYVLLQNDNVTPYIVVTKIDALGNQTVLNYPADYSFTPVSLGQGGGIVTPLVAIPNDGSRLFVEGATSLDQAIPYRNQGSSITQKYETSVDKLTLIAQETARQFSLGIRIPSTDIIGTNTVLPAAAIRANTTLGFDVSGNLLTGAVSNVIVSAAMIPVVQSSTVAAALTLLGGVSTTVYNSAIALLAPKASPTLTGVPVAPTPAVGTATTQIATAAFVSAADSVYKPIHGLIPTSITGTNTTASLTVTAGTCADTNGAIAITLPSTNWAVSNGNAINGYRGGTTLPNGSTIHFFACTGVSGSGVFADTALPPTPPAGYNSTYRRIFSLLTNGSGAPMAYFATEIAGGELLCIFSTPSLDFSNTGTPTSPTAQIVSVPNGINVVGKHLFYIGGASGTTTRSCIISYGVNSSPMVILSTAAPFSGSQTEAHVAITGDQTIHGFQVIGADNTISITTIGWYDPRR